MLRISKREEPRGQGEYTESDEGIVITKPGSFYVDKETGKRFWLSIIGDKEFYKEFPSPYRIAQEIKLHPDIFDAEFVEVHENEISPNNWAALLEFRPDLATPYLDSFKNSIWAAVAYKFPEYFTVEIINKYGHLFSSLVGGGAWESLTNGRPELFTKELVKKYANSRKGMSSESLTNLAAGNWKIFDTELVEYLISRTDYDNSPLRPFLRTLAMNNPKIFTDELLDRLSIRAEDRSYGGTSPMDKSTLGILASRRPELIKKWSDRFTKDDWLMVATYTPSLITKEILKKYSKSFESAFWAAMLVAGHDAVDSLEEYKDNISEHTWHALARDFTFVFNKRMVLECWDVFPKAVFDFLISKPELFDEEVVQTCSKKFSKNVWTLLYRLGRASKEQYLTAVSKNPESISTFVSEHDYLLIRKIEKYMEKNKIQQLTNKELQDLGVRENPFIKQLLQKKNGKPLTIEDIYSLESSLEKTEFYQHFGEYDDSEIQSHEDVSQHVRGTFTLGLKNVDGLSENTKRFLEKEMRTHKIGFMNPDEYGFILYKVISTDPQGDVGNVLIEEIQSDMARFIPKIFAGMRSENAAQFEVAKRRIDEWGEAYGGENGLKQITEEINKLTKNYVRILLNAFLKNFKGKNVYIMKADQMENLANLNPIIAKKIYDEIPRQYGFTDNEEIPWALKLENASSKWIIKISNRER